jgi:hypothetical protein
MGTRMAGRDCYLSPEDVVGVGRRGRLPIPTNTAVYRRSLFLEHGGYLPELKWHSDWYITAALAFEYGMCYVPDALACFDLHPTSYGRRGMLGPEQRRVVGEVVAALGRCTPEARDRVRRSSALAMFGLTGLRALASRRKDWWYITPLLVRRALRRSLEAAGRRMAPSKLAELYVRNIYPLGASDPHVQHGRQQEGNQ